MATEVGRISADMAVRGVRGYILGGVWWQAHYGNPGTQPDKRTALTELGRSAEIAQASGYIGSSIIRGGLRSPPRHDVGNYGICRPRTIPRF